MKLAKMKVIEMRKELEARGLDSTGTRPTLMKRLKEALNREQAPNTAQQRPKQSQPVRKVKKNVPDDRPADTQDTGSRERIVQQTAQNTKRQTKPHVGQNTAPPDRAPLTNADVEDGGNNSAEESKVLPSGSIEHSDGISMDERLQKRRERFGTVSNTPLATDDVIEKRRKRFGTISKDTEEAPRKRRRVSTDMDKQAVREHEEAKKRRAIKFGMSLNTGKKPGTKAPVSADEMEKRLKRQRRFQQVGF